MSLTIVFATATIFLQLYPHVLLSSLNPAWSLTIYNASSSPYTLTVMTIVASDIRSDRAGISGLVVPGIPETVE